MFNCGSKKGATEYAMRRNIKRLLHFLSLMPWWGILFAGIAGYVIWSLAAFSIARVDPQAEAIKASDSLAAFWFAFCLGAGLFRAVCGLFDRLRSAITDRSSATHWTGSGG